MTSPRPSTPAVRVRAAGFVVFRRDDSGAIEYLLLRHRNGGHWSFPKGHLEPGESELSSAQRETYEETGLGEKNLEVIPGFRTQIVYRYRLDAEGARRRGIATDTEPIEVEKTVTFFLARSSADRICLSPEHTECRWAPRTDAQRLLFHKDLTAVLTRADSVLHPS